MKTSWFINYALAAALLMLVGCRTPIGVNKVSPRAAYLNLHQNALNSRHYSADARRVLHRYGLDEQFKSHPNTTLEQLQTIACQDERRDVIYALTSKHWIQTTRIRPCGR